MKRDGMIFYRSFWYALSTLESEDRAHLLDAILSFGLDGVEPEDLYGSAAGMFGLIKPQIEANNRRYENGAKGGRPKKQTKTKDEPIKNQDETTTEPKEKEKKKEKDLIENNNFQLKECCAFEAFWAAYPRKKEKVRASKCYRARLKDGFSEEELLQAARAYAEECRKDGRDEKYIKLASTFLSTSTPFMDFLNFERGGAEDDTTSGSFKL